MTDITKCTNTDCPSMKLCYRHWAVDHKVWQSYALFKPDYTKGKCEHFLPRFKVVMRGKWKDDKS